MSPLFHRGRISEIQDSFPLVLYLVLHEDQKPSLFHDDVSILEISANNRVRYWERLFPTRCHASTVNGQAMDTQIPHPYLQHTHEHHPHSRGRPPTQTTHSSTSTNHKRSRLRSPSPIRFQLQRAKALEECSRNAHRTYWRSRGAIL